MKWIVGLGNPGADYLNTRHNAGVLLVNKLEEVISGQFSVDSYGWRKKKDVMVYESGEITLIKSAGVFMNESRRMISPLIPLLNLGEGKRYDNLFICHDDLDIRLGEYKIQKGRGPKVHGGLLSIERELKTKEFWRVRIGIDNRGSNLDGENASSIPLFNQRGGRGSSGDEYVLQRFSPEEHRILDETIEKVVEEFVKTFLNNENLILDLSP